MATAAWKWSVENNCDEITVESIDPNHPDVLKAIDTVKAKQSGRR